MQLYLFDPYIKKRNLKKNLKRNLLRDYEFEKNDHGQKIDFQSVKWFGVGQRQGVRGRVFADTLGRGSTFNGRKNISSAKDLNFRNLRNDLSFMISQSLQDVVNTHQLYTHRAPGTPHIGTSLNVHQQTQLCCHWKMYQRVLGSDKNELMGRQKK